MISSNLHLELILGKYTSYIIPVHGYISNIAFVTVKSLDAGMSNFVVQQILIMQPCR
jgi:hypothetical protein